MNTSPHPHNKAAAEALAQYRSVRASTLALIEGLSEEDCQAQSMPDASPLKWHLAHTSWFFETFVLESAEQQFTPFDTTFRVLFNSYYNAVGDKHPRPQRGLITRPGLAQVLAYRRNVDARMTAVLTQGRSPHLLTMVSLGLNHEQQHQELMLTDLKHLLSHNPARPAYRRAWPLAAVVAMPMTWLAQTSGLLEVGHSGADFCFDNEAPRHKTYLRPYALGRRLVSHGDWLHFMANGGYTDSRWWLSAGWDWVQSLGTQAPLYWSRKPGGTLDDWQVFTLHGAAPVDPCTPIVHISYFEADAYCRWAGHTQDHLRGARLPTEFEWENATHRGAAQHIGQGNFVETSALHPMPAAKQPEGLVQMMGDVWQWTSSSYAPYPGYQPWPGAVGEYNGKFMVNQYVLRGGSCVTPRSHIRATYRNFFPTDARWQFTGLRLARDVV